MRRAALLAIAAILVPAAPARAQGACDNIKTAYPANGGTGLRRPPLVLADSSMLLGVKPLAALGFDANARGCRQLSQAIEIMASRKRAGTLPRLIVLAVGNNGGVTRQGIDRAVAVAGRDRRVALVTPGGHAGAAAVMRSAARARPGRLVLVDWARTNPHRYGGDGIHIGPVGEAAEARFIRRRTLPFLPPPRSLNVPASARSAKRCGRVGALNVFVVRGAARIVCRRAEQVVRSRPSSWRYYAWSVTGPPPWTHVLSRGDGKVVVAARPRLR